MKIGLALVVSKGSFPSHYFWRPFAPCFASAELVRPVYLQAIEYLEYLVDLGHQTMMQLGIRNRNTHVLTGAVRWSKAFAEEQDNGISIVARGRRPEHWNVLLPTPNS